MHKYLPFLPIASHKLVSVSYCLLISQATPFAEEACDTSYHLWKNGKLLEGRPGRVFRTVRSRLASFNMSPVCLGALRECLLSNDANWQCQASHGWGEKWSGKTGLTGLVAMVLLSALAL